MSSKAYRISGESMLTAFSRKRGFGAEIPDFHPGPLGYRVQPCYAESLRNDDIKVYARLCIVRMRLIIRRRLIVVGRWRGVVIAWGAVIALIVVSATIPVPVVVLMPVAIAMPLAVVPIIVRRCRLQRNRRSHRGDDGQGGADTDAPGDVIESSHDDSPIVYAIATNSEPQAPSFVPIETG